MILALAEIKKKKKEKSRDTERALSTQGACSKAQEANAMTSQQSGKATLPAIVTSCGILARTKIVKDVIKRLNAAKLQGSEQGEIP